MNSSLELVPLQVFDLDMGGGRQRYAPLWRFLAYEVGWCWEGYVCFIYGGFIGDEHSGRVGRLARGAGRMPVTSGGLNGLNGIRYGKLGVGLHGRLWRT